MTLHEDLKAEYLLLQGFYEDYDKRALSLKALATPLLGVGIAAGLKDNSAGILIGTIAVALCLWALEVVWKTFQRRHADRILHIEHWFREGETEEIAPFQAFTSWTAAGKRYGSSFSIWLRLAIAPFVMLPYVVVLAAGVLSLSLITPATSAEGIQATQNQMDDLQPENSIEENRKSVVDEGASESASISPTILSWIRWTTTFVAFGLGLWFVSLLRRRRAQSHPSDTEVVPTTQIPRPSSVSMGSALTAAGAAWVAIGKISGAWIIFPALLAPLLTVAVVKLQMPKLKWWAFAIGFLSSVAIVAARLIDRRVAGQISMWRSSLAENLAATLANLTFVDYGTIAAALVAYGIAVVAALRRDAPR